VLAVVAPPALRLQRVLARDGVDEAGVRARMSAQLPEGEYERRADIIIHNTGDTAALEREVDAAWERLLQASHA
jgi:dephospho-CoA kinase